jgi:hypothetical protein
VPSVVESSEQVEFRVLTRGGALQLVHLYAERGSPKYEKAASGRRVLRLSTIAD